MLSGLFLSSLASFSFIGTAAVEPIVWLLPWIRLLFSEWQRVKAGKKKMITERLSLQDVCKKLHLSGEEAGRC